MPRRASTYDTVLRARVSVEFEKRLDAILDARGHGDRSELLREALRHYLDAEEVRLGILNEGPGKKHTGTPKGIRTPVNYRKLSADKKHRAKH